MKDEDSTGRTRQYFRLPPCAFPLALAALPIAGIAAPPDYPSKPIHIIAQFTPGTSTDILARVVAQKMSEN